MLAVPRRALRIKERRIMAAFERRGDKEEIMRRVDYYNRLVQPVPLSATRCRHLSGHTWRQHEGPSVYFFDTFEFLRYFHKHFCWEHKPGDVRDLFDTPTIVKTRPLACADRRFINSVVLNLDKVRHFFFVNDKIPFARKRPVVLFRGNIDGKPDRIRFVRMFKGRPGFDVAAFGGNPEPAMIGSKLSIADHLKYRYVMSLEGNDVATNLKWIMSSNCIAVMPRPTCEGWFMEGTLIPNYHYIEIKPDFSDVEQRIAYYEQHPDEAQQIIEHAHDYVRQFRDKERERIIAYLVVRKYFEHTLAPHASTTQISNQA